MQMAQLGHRMTKRIVKRADSNFSPVDMGHWEAERERRQRCGVHLEPIAEHNEYVGTLTSEIRCETDDAATDRLGRRFRRVGSAQHLDTLGNLPPVRLNR